MKKLLLILMLVSAVSGTQRIWSSTSSTDMNLATNYSGSGELLTTDTLVFNNTSVVNATATASLSVAHVDIQSTYSGNWTMTGYSLTLNNGGCIVDGTGNRTFGTALTMNGNGVLHIGSTVSNVSGSSCVATFNGNDTIDFDKESSLRSVIINDSVVLTGTAAVVLVKAAGVTQLVMNESSYFYGSSYLAFRQSIDCTLFTKHPTATMDLTGTVVVQPTNSTGSISVTIPDVNMQKSNFGILAATAGTYICNLSGDIRTRVFSYYATSAQTNATDVTLNTNGYDIIAPNIIVGSDRVGTKCNFNVENSTIKCNTLSSPGDDSLIINCSNAVFDVNDNYDSSSLEIKKGTFTYAKPTDLFMGHSMFASLNGYSPAWFYEENYSHRVFKNRAVGGTKIDNIFSRLDSCLTAYTPDRFFMWIGLNELSFEDVTKFDSATAWYFSYWTQIISKIKTAGIDSIYIVEMAPVGTDVSPMSATKQASFKRFNAALRDSCQSNGLFFIETYDSLLQPGYTDRINPLYATDGLHPNKTIAGSEYCAYLFSLAQAPIVTFRQSTDTLKLVCSNNQNVESWQWYQNNIAISGATDSVLPVIVDSTSATKSVYYCEISNGAENKKVGDWTIERKANSRTVSRKNRYK